MIRLSIIARQAIARLILPVLIVISFALVLAGRADNGASERARMALADALAPIYGVFAQPVVALRHIADLVRRRQTDADLIAENAKLRQWYAVAMALEAENAELKADLRWIPDAAPTYVTARVVADSGGVYARSVLLAIGPNHGVRRGEIALDAAGLVGRVTELGTRSARVLLITDMNSRIPVKLQASGARAMLLGDNGGLRLMYMPEGTHPAEGEAVVTSAEAGAFPAGLPVGTVHYGGDGLPSVAPAADLGRLDLVRIFDYGLNPVPERHG